MSRDEIIKGNAEIEAARYHLEALRDGQGRLNDYVMDVFSRALDALEREPGRVEAQAMAEALVLSHEGHIAALEAKLSEAAEVRVVLRQFYGVDEPISSADIARKMLAEVDRLRAQANADMRGSGLLTAINDDLRAENARLREQRDALVKAARMYLGAHDEHWNTDAADDETEANLYEAEDNAMTALRAAVASCTAAGGMSEE